MPSSKELLTTQGVIELAIKLGFLFVIISWCFEIIRPFITPVLWGAIIAVAIYPLHVKLTNALGGKEGRAATLFSLLSIAALITPIVMFTGAMADNLRELSQVMEAGDVHVKPPTANVAEWPIIGQQVYDFWMLASQNLDSALAKIEPQLKDFGSKMLGMTMSMGMSALQFIFALIVTGLLLANSQGGRNFVLAFSRKLVGEHGDEFVAMTSATIKSVAQGVLGIALIQSVLAAIGLVLADVPAAGLWALLVLIVAIVQLPPILILGPVAVYVFSVADSTTATVFLIWSIVVSSSDALLKPLLLGRGVDVPMLVILLGAIGGMIMSGIIGLFIGAVVLSVGYKLFNKWLELESAPTADEN